MYRPPIQNQKNSDCFYTNFSIIGIGRVRRSCHTIKEKEANDYSLRLYNKLKAQAEEPNKRQLYTIDEVLKRYWTMEAEHLASGFNAILPRLERIGSFFGLHNKWHHINDARVSDFISKLRADYVPIIKNTKAGKIVIKSNRLLNPRTINKILMTLGRINKLATENWNIEPAPFQVRKHILEVADSEKTYFSWEQEKKIFDALPSHWQDAFRFALLTGVRAQNIFVTAGRSNRAIRAGDVFLDEGYIRIYGKSRKPGGKIITIPIVDELRTLLEPLLKGKKPDDNIFVYPARHHLAGKPLGDYRKALYNAMEESGFNRKRGEGMHLTRHTVLTRIVQGGVDMEVAQRIAGHADIKTTQIYAKRRSDQLKDAMEKTLINNVTLAENRQKLDVDEKEQVD